MRCRLKQIVKGQTDLELVAEIAELLVGDGLDGGCVDGTRTVLGRKGHGILRHSCLASAGVRGHKHTVALQAGQQECQLLGNAAFVADNSRRGMLLHRQSRVKSVPLSVHHAMHAI